MTSQLVCRHCRQPVEFVYHVNGRRVVLDPGCHGDGTIDIDADGHAHNATPAALLDPAWPLRRLHRRSCPARTHIHRLGRDAHPERNQ